MVFLKALFILVYFSILIILSVYGCHRYYLVYLYYRSKKKAPRPLRKFENLPKVTVQLPLYNEMYVIERLLNSVQQINYPKELLQIQVLDDSTDETQNIARHLTEQLRLQGFDIHYLHRPHRHHFKAGALAAGLKSASADFIYIFDADFIPEPNIILDTIHYFTDSKVGMVQTRWGHINRKFSLLTEIQSILLDGHFVIEHTARNRSGLFFNFNGTAGVWRKKAILSGGGWEADTLTEDLDLSYRTQLQGWKFIYLPNSVTPAELPVEMNAFKAQQHRWVKGSIQTSKKLLRKIWASPVPLPVKIEATFHLTNNLSYLLMLALFILLLPAMFVRLEGGWMEMIFIDFPLFFASFFSISAFYICSQKEIYSNWIERLKYIPLISSIGIGLSISNAKAVWEALRNQETPFLRTPKYGVHAGKKSWKTVKYKGRKSRLIWLELAMGIYFGLLAVFSLATGRYIMTPFMMLFHIGFMYTWTLSTFQGRKRKSPKVLVSGSTETPFSWTFNRS